MKTMEVKRSNLLIRNYEKTYGASTSNLDKCKLFWATVFSPLAWVFKTIGWTLFWVTWPLWKPIATWSARRLRRKDALIELAARDPKQYRIVMSEIQAKREHRWYIRLLRGFVDHISPFMSAVRMKLRGKGDKVIAGVFIIFGLYILGLVIYYLFTHTVITLVVVAGVLIVFGAVFGLILLADHGKLGWVGKAIAAPFKAIYYLGQFLYEGAKEFKNATCHKIVIKD